jgi:hypothetical protein
MRMSMSGRTGTVPKSVSYCLAGLLALCSQAKPAHAEDLFAAPLPRPAVDASGNLQARLAADDVAASQPATRLSPVSVPDGGVVLLGGKTVGAATTREVGVPATAPMATLTPAAPKPDERVGDIERTDAGGEIVPLEESKHGPLTYSLQAFYLGGSIGGTAQTPLIGVKRSASGNRPRLDGLGIDSTNSFDGEFAVHIDPNQEVFIGAQRIHEDGTSVTRAPLVFKGITFPARTALSSNTRFDWYRLGYRYNFLLDTAPNGVPDLTLSPAVDVIYWDNDVHINGGPVGNIGNPLTKFGFQLGATIAWRPNGGPLSLEASLAGFPQSSRLVNISTETVLARYRFYRWHKIDFNVLLGVAWEQQQWNDSRTPLANNVRINMGPMVLTGLQFNF